MVLKLNMKAIGFIAIAVAVLAGINADNIVLGPNIVYPVGTAIQTGSLGSGFWQKDTISFATITGTVWIEPTAWLQIDNGSSLQAQVVSNVTLMAQSSLSISQGASLTLETGATVVQQTCSTWSITGALADVHIFDSSSICFGPCSSLVVVGHPLQFAQNSVFTVGQRAVVQLLGGLQFLGAGSSLIIGPQSSLTVGPNSLLEAYQAANVTIDAQASLVVQLNSFCLIQVPSIYIAPNTVMSVSSQLGNNQITCFYRPPP